MIGQFSHDGIGHIGQQRQVYPLHVEYTVTSYLWLACPTLLPFFSKYCSLLIDIKLDICSLRCSPTNQIPRTGEELLRQLHCRFYGRLITSFISHVDRLE